MSAERKDKELRSMFCGLSCLKSSPDKAERSVPSLCHMLLSLDWGYQKGHPGTRKRAGWLLLTKTLLLHWAVELSRRKCTLPSCTSATVHSCSHPRLCLFSFLMSTVPIKNPAKHTHTAPCSASVTNVIYPFDQANPQGHLRLLPLLATITDRVRKPYCSRSLHISPVCPLPSCSFSFNLFPS